MANVSSSNGLEKRPKLRFPGFDEPWSNRMLGEMLCSRIEKQTPSEDAPLMAFTAEGGVEPKGERYDRSYLVKSEKKLYKRTEYNDFIYSSNNLDVGSIGLNKYGTAVISDVYEIFSVNENTAPTFVSELIQRPRVLAEVLKYRQGCLYGQYRIYAEDFLKVPAYVPSIHEQVKISAFLDALDNKMAAQNKLIEALKKYKRGVLSAVYSDNNSICSWEVTTYPFSDLANRRKEKYDPRSGVHYPCVELEHIEQETGRIIGHVPSVEQSSIKSVCKPGDVLFGKLRPYLKKYAFVTECMVCSSEIWSLVPTEILLPEYLFYLVQTDEFMKIANVSSGTKMPRAEWSNVEKAMFGIPSKDIQIQIVNTLRGIDAKILAAQDTLSSLQLTKRGLLQQLFI